MNYYILFKKRSIMVKSRLEWTIMNEPNKLWKINKLTAMFNNYEKMVELSDKRKVIIKVSKERRRLWKI